MVKSPSACMVLLQSMWIGPNHCQNFMDSGSESATYLYEVHVDLENVPSQIISATEASRLEKLTPQSLDFWGIQCPEKTLIQSKLCQNSDLEESIMQQDN